MDKKKHEGRLFYIMRSLGQELQLLVMLHNSEVNFMGGRGSGVLRHSQFMREFELKGSKQKKNKMHFEVQNESN